MQPLFERVCVNRLKKIRQSYGLTQEAFAKRVGLSRKYVVTLESGKASPTLDTIEKIATALELSTHDLIDEGDYRCSLRGDPLMLCGHPVSHLLAPYGSPHVSSQTQYCTSCEKVWRSSREASQHGQKVFQETSEESR